MVLRALMIVNPIAGRGGGRRVAERLAAALGERSIRGELAITREAGEASDATDLAAEHDLVVVVGGDGTLNEVINGLEADRPVALYPLGTGNVAAKELGLPRRVAAFCDMVRAGRERHLDLGGAEGRRFVSFAGIGFDAQVAARVAAGRQGAIRMSSYVGPVLRCLATYGFPPLELSVDGAPPVRAGGFALVSNVRAYGGPLVIAHQAKHDDGLFDVCVLPPASRPRHVASLAALALRCPGWSGIRTLRGRAVHATSPRRVPYQVDGDPAGFLPATFAMLERKLRIIVP